MSPCQRHRVPCLIPQLGGESNLDSLHFIGLYLGCSNTNLKVLFCSIKSKTRASNLCENISAQKILKSLIIRFFLFKSIPWAASKSATLTPRHLAVEMAHCPQPRPFLKWKKLVYCWNMETRPPSPRYHITIEIKFTVFPCQVTCHMENSIIVALSWSVTSLI